MGQEYRITVPFRKSISPTETGHLDYRIQAAATVEKINVRIYSGVENSLQIRPILLKKGAPTPQPMLNYVDGADDYITGNDDRFEFDITMQADEDDVIQIHYTNTDPNYAYSLVVDVVVDYRAGKVSVA